ncbi:MAG: hypothetical protein AAF975_06975 [Spirochaetota bacterium]
MELRLRSATEEQASALSAVEGRTLSAVEGKADRAEFEANNYSKQLFKDK